MLLQLVWLLLESERSACWVELQFVPGNKRWKYLYLITKTPKILHKIYWPPTHKCRLKKGKVVPVLNSLSIIPWRHIREWRYSSINLDLGSRQIWVVSFMPWPLYLQGKSPRYPLDSRLGGAQSQSGHCEEKSLPLPGTEPWPSSP
jgi:hypothetical protein